MISGCKTYNLIKTSNYSRSFRVKVEGFSGGIWILWRNSVKVKITIRNKQYVHMKVGGLREVPTLITIVYASPQPQSRSSLWQYLYQISCTVNMPWVVYGCFNSILEVGFSLSI